MLKKEKVYVLKDRSLRIEIIQWQGSSRKEVILKCNKSYATLALDCTLNNLKGTLSTLEIDRRCKNNNIEDKYISSTHLWTLSLNNTLLNSEPYTV